jgi:hypothetical protein
VSDLTTNTACEAVRQYNDGTSAACTYQSDCVPLGSELTCVADLSRLAATQLSDCPLGDFGYTPPAWTCVDDPHGALAATGTNCASVMQVAAMLNLGGCEVDINLLQRAIPVGTLISHACPRACNSCQLACEVNMGTWVGNTWASDGNSFTPAVW